MTIAPPQPTRGTTVGTTVGTEERIPFFDWPSRYRDCVDDVLAAVREVAESDELILKWRVADLEGQVADRSGRAHAVATSSATAALTLTLTALGIGPGDEVVTPAFSFISSASAIALAGATPVFADVDEETACLDVAAAEAAVGPRTRAVLPAYLFTSSPDLPAFARLTNRHSLALVEDSAVALGARVGGRPAGGTGTAGVFSFYPAKPLGGIGDAGMVVTDDATLAHRLRMLRNHGQDPAVRFVHEIIGINARMDEVTAAYLLRRLPALDGLLARRRALAENYTARLAPLAPLLQTPPAGFADRAVYTYVVRTLDRDRLRTHLERRGIETVVYYPRPLHLQPAFAHLGGQRDDFPVAERLSRWCVALPLHHAMGMDDVARVADAVADFYGVRP